ncbi:MAG: hypothetical protein KC588_02110 [Nitrospira sp.]|nr:hypothetical protein [Nitrospira sp.]
MRIKAKKQTTQPATPHPLCNDGSLAFLVKAFNVALHQGDAQRVVALKGILVSTANPDQQTPLAALNTLILAGQAGVVAPPWAVQLVDQGLRRRIQDPSASLDKTFGFSAAKGKTPPAHQVLYTMRNAKLAVPIHLMVLSGQEKDVDKACGRMADKLREMKNWNRTGYDLGFLRDGSTGRDAMTARLHQLYNDWLKATPTEDLKILATIAQSPDILPLLLNE